jgi:16S rRNA (guanine527-N7)-methyltransferase
VSRTLERLERAAGALGLALPPGALAHYAIYLREIERWRRRINLTAASTEQDLVDLHVVDSLLPLSVVTVPRDARLADVGSGAGFPGVPIMIARPDLRITLVEASSRRAAFLEHVARTLGISGLTVSVGRAEVLGRAPQYREQFDVVVSRATARAAVMAELCLPLAAVAGMAVLLKGPGGIREMIEARPLVERLGGAVEAIEVRSLPTVARMRVIAILRKRAPCSPEYPRPAAQLGR